MTCFRVLTIKEVVDELYSRIELLFLGHIDDLIVSDTFPLENEIS